MRAISLWQPWASLLVLGLKRFETRDYPFPSGLRGKRIIIHAAKKRAEFHDDFVQGVDHYMRRNGADPARLPFGAIVGTVELGEAIQLGSRIADEPRSITWDVSKLCERLERFGSAEVSQAQVNIENALGDFRPGRWAWECINPSALPSPIPYSGKQGFFNVEPFIVAKIGQQIIEQLATTEITREITRPALNEGIVHHD